MSKDPTLIDSELPLASAESNGVTIDRLRFFVIEGPAAGELSIWDGPRGVLGSHPGCNLVLADPTVSRFHCEVELCATGARVRDLGSRNGTIVDGVRIVDAYLRAGSLLRLGTSVARFDVGAESSAPPISSRHRFGSLVGRSLAMRRAFALLERAAASSATVLVEGETGTGKEGAASAIHEQGARRKGPFVVVDCSAIPRELLESELFGHEKGAFTGASSRRIGAFEAAAGGTIFLDEIGELSMDLQPKLLRALEQREIRRVGSNEQLPIDVRVIAATNRDLRTEVDQGRFRSDLYFRLAVLRVWLPPLRERPEDLAEIVEDILSSLHADEKSAAALTDPAHIARLQAAQWPGNVRELRNHLERCLVLDEPVPLQEAPCPSELVGTDGYVRYPLARRRAIRQFEKRYVQSLLAIHDGSVSRAAKAAGISRVYVYRLMRRAGMA